MNKCNNNEWWSTSMNQMKVCLEIHNTTFTLDMKPTNNHPPNIWLLCSVAKAPTSWENLTLWRLAVVYIWTDMVAMPVHGIAIRTHLVLYSLFNNNNVISVENKLQDAKSGITQEFLPKSTKTWKWLDKLDLQTVRSGFMCFDQCNCFHWILLCCVASVSFAFYITNIGVWLVAGVTSGLSLSSSLYSKDALWGTRIGISWFN